jgi:hypothetical protein
MHQQRQHASFSRFEMEAVLATDRCKVVSLTKLTTNIFYQLSIINSFKHVGQLVLDGKADDFRVMMMATERGYATVEDIVSTPMQPELISVVKTQVDPPAEPGLTLFGGAVAETMAYNGTVKFDPERIQQLCDHFRTDRIGIVRSVCRSTGRFRKDHTVNRFHPARLLCCFSTQYVTSTSSEFSEGAVVAVTVVWIGTEKETVKIV